MKILFCFLIPAICISLPNDVFSKCPLIKWQIQGAIKSSEKKIAIEGAKVFIFLGESETTNSNGNATDYPDYFISNKDGDFSATSYYDSFSSHSIIKGDECSKEPSIIEVIVTKQGYLSKRVRFEASELDISKIEHLIILNDIFLDEPRK